MITLMLAILGAWFVALFAGPAIYAAMGLAGVIPGLLMTVALMLGLFVYRDFRLADLPRVILDTVETTGVVMALVMTASLLGYCISVSRLPQVFGSALTALTATPLLYLLICNVLLLVIGFFMEALAAMLVLIPILVPPALALGIDPVQFGLVFVLNLMIGTITPPVGGALRHRQGGERELRGDRSVGTAVPVAVVRRSGDDHALPPADHMAAGGAAGALSAALSTGQTARPVGLFRRPCSDPDRHSHVRALELRVPPVVLVVICAAWMAALAYAMPATVPVPVPARLGAAVVLILLGALVALAGVVAFRRHNTTVNPFKPEQSTSLVATGVYRLSRNPMYLGLLLALMGWSAYLANWASVLVLPAFVAYMNRFQIQPEERALTERFGSQFLAYTKAVRRWL